MLEEAISQYSPTWSHNIAKIKIKCNPDIGSFTKLFVTEESSLPTCQKMKCSLIRFFTASLLQTSRLRHWQAKSCTFCMLIMSHLFCIWPHSLAWRQETTVGTLAKNEGLARNNASNDGFYLLWQASIRTQKGNLQTSLTSGVQS